MKYQKSNKFLNSQIDRITKKVKTTTVTREVKSKKKPSFFDKVRSFFGIKQTPKFIQEKIKTVSTLKGKNKLARRMLKNQIRTEIKKRSRVYAEDVERYCYRSGVKVPFFATARG